MARFVNIDQKYGGGYLPENKTWAKQTIAHNTLVVNEQSHFRGHYKTGVKFHSEKYFFDSGDPDIQVVSAKENNAYQDVSMHRTMALVRIPAIQNPFIIDVFRISSGSKNQYDLPFLYKGQIMSVNFDYTSSASLSPLGSASGYQHLWKEAAGRTKDQNAKLSWLSDSRFHTLTTLVSSGDSLIFARLGANDPEFNLRRDPLFLIRKRNAGNAVFVSLIESHGHYSPVDEIATNAISSLSSLSLDINNEEYTAISFIDKSNTTWFLIIANKMADRDVSHTLEIDGEVYSWEGPYSFFSKKNLKYTEHE
jgi:hypothetical protein